MAKRLNSSGEREMTKHIKTVQHARKELKSSAGKLEKSIGKKMTFALSQDAKIMRDMKKSDRKK